MKTFVMTQWRKFLVVVLITITIASLSSKADSAQLLKVAGDEFAAHLYQSYSQVYEQQTGEKFQYATVGNLGGIRLFIDKIIDMGATSLIPTPIEQNQMEDGLLMVPTGGGTIAIVYNIQNTTIDVKLSREQLAGIFTGKISNWEQIDTALPNLDIRVVVCSESSAQSFVLSKYLEKITGGQLVASRKPDWGFKVFSAFGEDNAIAGEVRRIDGAIGYVSKDVALAKNLTIAGVENKQGRYVQPSLEETKKAFKNVQFKDNFTTESIEDPPDGYPLVSLTWLMVYQRYLKPDLLEANVKLLTWIMTNGQALNETLGYTKIPEDVTLKVLETLKSKLKIY